jgi:hypothetical protein
MLCFTDDIDRVSTTSTEGRMQQDAWWRHIEQFAKDALTGIGGFICVALPAPCLFSVIRLVEHVGTSKFVIYVLTCVEYAVVCIDSVLLAALTGINAWKVIRRSLQ